MPVEPPAPHQRRGYLRPTIIAGKSTRARHLPHQSTVPRQEPRVGKHMSGNDLDIPAQPAKLRTERACKFKASIYKSQQSAKRKSAVRKNHFSDRVCEPESLQKQ